MTDEDISDPLAGVAFCNRHIRKLEAMIEEAHEKGDLATAAKCEGHLVKWTEELEHFLHQAYQQGKTTDDLSKKLAEKKRFEGTG